MFKQDYTQGQVLLANIRTDLGMQTFIVKRTTAANSTYKKLAVQCSADTFVVNQTLVLRISICGKNRQLRQAQNR